MVLRPARQEGKDANRRVLTERPLLVATGVLTIVSEFNRTSRYFGVVSNLRGEDSSVPRGLYFQARESRLGTNHDKSGQSMFQALFFAPPVDEYVVEDAWGLEDEVLPGVISLGALVDDPRPSHNLDVVLLAGSSPLSVDATLDRASSAERRRQNPAGPKRPRSRPLKTTATAGANAITSATETKRTCVSTIAKAKSSRRPRRERGDVRTTIPTTAPHRVVAIGGVAGRNNYHSDLDAYAAPSLAAVAAGAWRGLSRRHNDTFEKRLEKAADFQVEAPSSTAYDAVDRTVALDGAHRGCFDRRAKEGGCQFDGKHSLARRPDDGRFLIYSRTNLAFHGGRFVQVTRSRTSDLLRTPWDAYKVVTFQNYDPNATRTRGNRFSGNIYYPSVNPNPVDFGSDLSSSSSADDDLNDFGSFDADDDADDDEVVLDDRRRHKTYPKKRRSSLFQGFPHPAAGTNADGRPSSLIGLFPVMEKGVHQTGYVGMALTCDGLNFSPITPLVAVPHVTFGRCYDMPVDGWARDAQGRLFLFVQRNVPGVTQKKYWEPTVIAQYEVNATELRRWTRDMRRSLGASCGEKNNPEERTNGKKTSKKADFEERRGQHSDGTRDPWREPDPEVCTRRSCDGELSLPPELKATVRESTINAAAEDARQRHAAAQAAHHQQHDENSRRGDDT